MRCAPISPSEQSRSNWEFDPRRCQLAILRTAVRLLMSEIWFRHSGLSGTLRVGEVYNLGGDDVYSVQEVIEAIRVQVTVPFKVEQRPELMRSCDEPVTAGDNTKFRTCCSWEPQIRLAITLRDMLDWWRIQLVGAVSPGSRQEVARIHHLGS